MPTSVGPDGIAVSGYGWTNQSTQFNSNISLESFSAPNSGIFNQAVQYGYSAESILIQDAIVAQTHASTGFLTRVFIPQTFTCGHLDIGVHAGTTPSFIAAIFPYTGALAGTATPLVWAAATASPATPSTCTLAWNGASSPSSVTLSGGNFYYVYTYTATASTTVGGSTMSDSNMANINLTSTTYDTATASNTTVSAATTLTGVTISAIKIWVGLRA